MFIWIVFIGIAVISYIVQARLKSKFEKMEALLEENG